MQYYFWNHIPDVIVRTTALFQLRMSELHCNFRITLILFAIKGGGPSFPNTLMQVDGAFNSPFTKPRYTQLQLIKFCI